MKVALLGTAGFYTLWAFWVLGWPGESLGWSKLAPPVASALPFWRFTGLVDLVLAGGLVAASIRPCQYWPVTSVGLTLHATVTAGYALSLRGGEMPLAAWPTVLLHDAFWCIPLGLVLHGVHCSDADRKAMGCREVQSFALRSKSQYGVSLLEMSSLSPVLVVFLRELGCGFCRASISELAGRRKEIEKLGAQIALVHMSSDADAERILTAFGLADLPRVSDRNRSLYHAFGLRRASIMQMIDPRAMLRMVLATAKFGYHKALGDRAQLPGVFFVFHGEVLRSFRHQSVTDRPDLVALVAQQDYPIAS